MTLDANYRRGDLVAAILASHQPGSSADDVAEVLARVNREVRPPNASPHDPGLAGTLAKPWHGLDATRLSG